MNLSEILRRCGGACVPVWPLAAEQDPGTLLRGNVVVTVVAGTVVHPQ